MNILLTGALGFIGKNFLIARPKDWLVTSLDINIDKIFQKNIKNTKFYQINLSDKDQVEKLAKKINQKFDVCLHLAANGDPALSTPDPGWDLKSTTLTLINVCQNFSIKKLIYLSSGAVYDGHRGLISPKSVINPTLPYAISHHSAEQYARFFKESGQVKEYIVIRFFGAYGPHEPPRKIYTKLVKTFGTKRIYSSSGVEKSNEQFSTSSNNSEFTICGNGQNLIDAMYVKDTIAGFVKVIKSKKANLTVDFCQGDHPNINQLVKEAAYVFDIDVKIKHDGHVPEYNQFYASPKEFKEIFNFSPKISLEEGLKKLYLFYAK